MPDTHPERAASRHLLPAQLIKKSLAWLRKTLGELGIPEEKQPAQVEKELASAGSDGK